MQKAVRKGACQLSKGRTTTVACRILYNPTARNVAAVVNVAGKVNEDAARNAMADMVSPILAKASSVMT